METFAGALTFAVGAMFIVSSCAKAASPSSTLRMMRELRMPYPTAASAGLVAAEAIAGILIFFPSLNAVSSATVFSLGIAFSVTAVVASWSKVAVTCACLGGDGEPLGFPHFIRGLVIALAGVAIWALPSPWSEMNAILALNACAAAVLVLMIGRVVMLMRKASADRQALADSTYAAVSV